MCLLDASLGALTGSTPTPIAPRTPIQHLPEIPHQGPPPAAFGRGVPLHGGQSAASRLDPPPYRRPIDRPVLGPELQRQPAGGFNYIVRYAGGTAAPDGLEHTTRRESDSQLEPVELGVTPPVEHHRTGGFAVTTATPGFLIVRLRCGRQGPVHHHTHVGLVDPEAERGAYTIETRSLWGFDAQVASGKLRECAGCAPQGDTEVDTLHRPVAGSPRVWTH